MSRSRRPQCSVGRNCPCCGNQSEARNRRYRAWAASDRRQDLDVPPVLGRADVKFAGDVGTKGCNR